MFYKYYVAETIVMRDGKSDLNGSKVGGVWFWQSPAAAYKKMLNSEGTPVNFRRIK